ncbi:LAQU0S19e00716g1_1 [Lachancea quebecensis]|uniref:LAQU0S19e00716g1_1 n=1 Tax=Lachancea quebecensis TaxID=1654605 RepID=A0A0P1L4J2_9SACH|nr:LAQU0S19e00716g1_1 [Lachancea quebecensis]
MSQYIANPRQQSRQLHRNSPGGQESHFAASSVPFNQRNSILDPHLSVLQLLDRADPLSELSSLKHSEVAKPPTPERTGLESVNCSISESWQSIKHTDCSMVNIQGDATHQHAGILSSSDTSEDEPDAQLSPSPNNFGFPNSALSIFPEAPNTLEASSLREYQNPEIANSREENDNETITMSLMNSSNSFVMPKLSLIQQSQKFCILIVGKPSQRFYRDIPRAYHKMFEVRDISHLSPREMGKYSAVMIIFSEPKEGKALLEKVAARNNNIIAVCQRGQQQQISSLLNRFSKSNQIRLVYHLTVMSDHQDVHRLLRYLYTLSIEVDSGYETEIGSRKTRKRRKSSKKRSPQVTVNRWVIWSISLTVGVGLGYCISCLLSSTSSTLSVTLHSGDEAAIMEDIHNPPHESPFDSYLRQLLLAVKKAVKQVNSSFKQYLNGQSLPVLWMQRMGKEWLSEASDPTLPGVTALDLVLV